jgi:radical SAM superfamily enzyme YgiQ (UPF0313 family)
VTQHKELNRKLKIKLISPKMSLRPMDTELKRRMSPPLSLVILASLTPPGHEVWIEDENIRRVSFSDHPDLVGITVNVDTAFRAVEISEMYRKRGIRVIFGGIYSSAEPERLLEHCDALCIGEAEELWHGILEDAVSDNLKKIYQHTGVTDLTKVPFPDWKFIRGNDYMYHNIIVTSRGCPFKCEFCYNSCEYVNSAFRNRPIEKVVEEIRRMNTRQVLFIDDNLIGNIRWTSDFLDAITGMGLSWHAAVSANLVHHPELVSKMAQAGCRSLFIGFESIHPQSLSSVNKSQNRVQEYETLIGMLHNHRIMVNASMVFGFDSDTPETFKLTLDWLVRNRVETMTSHILTPYPGTKLYKRLLEEGRITDTDLRKYNTSNVVFRPAGMTAEELRKGYLGMYRDFYSMKNIIRRRPQHRSQLAPYFLFNFGYRKFGRLTSVIGTMGLMASIGRIGRKLAYGLD